MPARVFQFKPVFWHTQTAHNLFCMRKYYRILLHLNFIRKQALESNRKEAREQKRNLELFHMASNR